MALPPDRMASWITLQNQVKSPGNVISRCVEEMLPCAEHPVYTCTNIPSDYLLCDACRHWMSPQPIRYLVSFHSLACLRIGAYRYDDGANANSPLCPTIFFHDPKSFQPVPLIPRPHQDHIQIFIAALAHPRHHGSHAAHW